jgi:type IV pilus assembly protein PilC
MAAATTFKYSVRDRSGNIVRGKITAESTAVVATKLKRMGYAPVSITRADGGIKKEINIPGFSSKKVTLKDLAIMSRQFATMINAGLSLLRALSILEEQTENKEFARIMSLLRADIEAGNSLSGAMAKFPNAFPPLMINMTRAGEIGGFLDQVLLQIADNYEAETKLRSKVKAAMTYPVAVLVIALVAVTAMLIFIVPTFANLFSGLGGELPAPTRLLVAMSDILKSKFIFIVIIMIALSMTWKRIKNKPRTRDIVDPLKLKMPVFGPLFQKIAIARFTRNLATMMHAGVPILQSLDIVADTTGNVVVARAVRDVQESVRSGESLTEPLNNHPVFPSMVVQMMAVGEDTGALDSMLYKISEFYDQEVEATTESLTALIEPLMIVFMGGIVGSMIVAMYMPIFKVFDLIK